MFTTLIFDFGRVLFPNLSFIKKQNPEKFRKCKQVIIDLYPHIEACANLDKEQLKKLIFAYQSKDLLTKDRDAIYRSLVEIDKDVFGVIKTLSTKYTIVALVNEAPKWTQVRRKLFSLDQYFKEYFVSSEIGLEKPNSKIFEFVLNKLNVQANKCLFVDDSEKNIEQAKRMGFGTVWYRNSQKVQKELRELLTCD